MRVIGGIYRSRALKAPHGERVRPTSDKLRETLFDILGPSVAGSWFVDAYAGSGAIGIEACSRGAERVFWIESHRASQKVLQENVRALGIAASQATLLARPAASALPELARRPEVAAHGGVDFIFLDPPYALADEYDRVLQLLGNEELVHAETLVIAEHARRQAPAEQYGSLRLSRRVEQGDSALSFYRPASLQ
jgi:16S rRNA (guanine(966)-N(2))-methyltransferase RsmD